MGAKRGIKVEEVLMASIDRPANVHRMSFDPERLRELADSIKAEGLHEPILLRPVSGRYEIVAGDRRFLAHQILGRETIPSIVRDMDDVTCEIVRATENLQRVDLTPIEEARVYDRMIEVAGMPIKEVSRRCGKSIIVVKGRLALLVLPDEYQVAVHEGRLSVGVAVSLSQIDDPVMMKYYLDFAVRGGCTVRTADEWVEHWKLTRGTVEYEDQGGEMVVCPVESRPTYFTCRCCQGPCDIKDSIVISVCPACARVIMSGGGAGAS